jgi:hypothetical protein
MEREAKKSESIEVRVPHAVKQAFMARCRAQGRTASEAIRGFVQGEIDDKTARSRNRLRRLRPAAAGIVATLMVTLVTGPATVSAAPHFGPEFSVLDRNHDGVISPAEYGDDRRRNADLLGCGKGELLLPLARESMPEVHDVRPFAVAASAFTFATVDRNQDGRISREEYAAHWLQVVQKGFKRFDANHDGTISRREYSVAYKPLFMGDPPDIAPFLELDDNRDGRSIGASSSPDLATTALLSIPPQQPRQLALDPDLVGAVALGVVSAIGRIEPDHRAFLAEIFERRLGIVDQSHDDLAVAGGLGAADQRIVAIQDTGLDHRVTRDFERIMLACAEQRGGDGKHRRTFERLDRRTGGDPAMQRNLDHVVGGLAQRNWSRGSLHLGRRRHSGLLGVTALGHAQHFERAGTVRQATDELAFLERADQPVHARLGFEIERFLHFLERRRDTSFVQSIGNKADELVLLAREHPGSPV